MSDELNAFERLDADMPLPLDLRALEDRVIDDSLAWEARVPSAERLMRFARELPAAGALQTDESPASGGPGSRPGGAPERIRHRAAPGHAPRRHALAAYAAAFGLMTLTTLLLVQLASFRMVGTSVPPRQAQATVTALTSTPSVLPTASATTVTEPTTTPSPEAAGLPAGGGNAPQVNRAVVGAAPSGDSGVCDTSVTVDLMASFEMSSLVTNASVTFRWIVSFGAVAAANPITAQYTNVPGASVDAASLQAYRTKWIIPASEADGTPQWAAVEVLSPNHFMSPRSMVSYRCDFTVRWSTSYMNGVGPGDVPPGYDCTKGGDQTFTFTGTITLTPAPGNHTVIYHWQRSDGVSEPDQTVTVPPGTTSVDVQPDTWTLHQTDPNMSVAESIVVTTPANDVQYIAYSSKGCL